MQRQMTYVFYVSMWLKKYAPHRNIEHIGFISIHYYFISYLVLRFDTKSIKPLNSMTAKIIEADDRQGGLVGCFEINARGHPGLESLAPTEHAETPLVAFL